MMPPFNSKVKVLPSKLQLTFLLSYQYGQHCLLLEEMMMKFDDSIDDLDEHDFDIMFGKLDKTMHGICLYESDACETTRREKNIVDFLFFNVWCLVVVPFAYLLLYKQHITAA